MSATSLSLNIAKLTCSLVKFCPNPIFTYLIFFKSVSPQSLVLRAHFGIGPKKSKWSVSGDVPSCSVVRMHHIVFSHQGSRGLPPGQKGSSDEDSQGDFSIPPQTLQLYFMSHGIALRHSLSPALCLCSHIWHNHSCGLHLFFFLTFWHFESFFCIYYQ